MQERQKIGMSTQFHLKPLPYNHDTEKNYYLTHWKPTLFLHLMLPFLPLSLLLVCVDYNIFEAFCSVIAMEDSYRKY